ncbi:MAG: phosphotransferase, partial [Roseiflexaceae bacterium]|nr:phosphotransferase [Roseiflexaceae bacterium]
MTEIAVLSALTGLHIVAAERCAMGFENRTERATLADGRVVIIQRLANRGMAAHKIRLAQTLPARLAEAGIRAPAVLQADAQATPPFMVREYIPGEIGAAQLATDAGAIALAEAMGRLLQTIALVKTAGLGLHSGWANPARLVAQARGQLSRHGSLIEHAHAAVLEQSIAQAEPLLAGYPGVFAHGDYCPVNVIVEDGDLQRDWGYRQALRLALIDLEFARVAHPLLDVAWWNWVVRYHHAVRWQVAFPHLLAAAGIPDTGATWARITVIQHLRLLEALDYNAALSPERGA